MFYLQLTLFHNMIEGSAESSFWNHTSVIMATIELWFAASHQPWNVYEFISSSNSPITDL